MSGLSWQLHANISRLKHLSIISSVLSQTTICQANTTKHVFCALCGWTWATFTYCFQGIYFKSYVWGAPCTWCSPQPYLLWAGEKSSCRHIMLQIRYKDGVMRGAWPKSFEVQKGVGKVAWIHPYWKWRKLRLRSEINQYVLNVECSHKRKHILEYPSLFYGLHFFLFVSSYGYSWCGHVCSGIAHYVL